MKVLTIHNMGNPLKRREGVISIESLFKNYSKEIKCLNHDAQINLPENIKAINFDLIILGPTFLYSRFNPKLFNKLKKKYDFIANMDTCKIALPQDEYTYSEILDEWMCDWEISRVYSVLPKFKKLIYPKYIKQGEIKEGFTIYINEKLINKFKERKMKSREIDISYRASALPESYGSIGQLKKDIGLSASKTLNEICLLKTDISVDKKNIITGIKWYRFLENSKACIVTPSGSSIHDPKGSIRIAVEKYKLKYPKSRYKDVEKNCFPKLDKKFVMTAISPRNIEAGLAGTVQICIDCEFSNILEENKDYIPLKGDLSNIKEVIDIIKNKEKMEKISNNCKNSLLNSKKLNEVYFLEEILSFANSFKDFNNERNNEDELFNIFLKRYSYIEKRSGLVLIIKDKIIKTIRKIIGEKFYKRILINSISKRHQVS
tara:strand:+ start:738 stop:2033 length:1296 start_codon:yes stop_codon:yes gene_type:complete